MTDEKPHKRTSCPAVIREKIWRRWCGDVFDSGVCFVCGRTVSYSEYHVGHIKSVKDGGTWGLQNCRVVCQPCNTSCGTMSLRQFKRDYFPDVPTPKPIKKVRTKKTKAKKKQKRKTTTKKKASVKKRATKERIIDMPKISWGSSLSRLF